MCATSITTPSLQTILSRFIDDYQQRYSVNAPQIKVIRHLTQCRTPALGGQSVQCDHCDFTQHRYHSCRNRHCPKCQHTATQQWCERQRNHTLPVTYYHVVFTLPDHLNPWVQCHAAVIYRCLFAAVWHTIKTFGADTKRLNGEMGMSAVLHTWGQSLIRHVHLHCLIPGGALTAQGQWHPAKSTYLFPVRALSRHFRGDMVSALRRAHTNGELPLLDDARVSADLNQLMQKDWVVYSQAYIKQADSVVRYLGRYTHKIALSESRLREVNDEQVVFGYKDYRDGKTKPMCLSGVEFLRRFLLHVLPPGFMRVRHYGFLANRVRENKLSRIRDCLVQTRRNDMKREESAAEPRGSTPITRKPCPCPKCHNGQLRVRYEIAPQPLHGR